MTTNTDNKATVAKTSVAINYGKMEGVKLSSAKTANGKTVGRYVARVGKPFPAGTGNNTVRVMIGQHKALPVAINGATVTMPTEFAKGDKLQLRHDIEHDGVELTATILVQPELRKRATGSKSELKALRDLRKSIKVLEAAAVDMTLKPAERKKAEAAAAKATETARQQDKALHTIEQTGRVILSIVVSDRIRARSAMDEFETDPFV